MTLPGMLVGSSILITTGCDQSIAIESVCMGAGCYYGGDAQEEFVLADASVAGDSAGDVVTAQEGQADSPGADSTTDAADDAAGGEGGEAGPGDSGQEASLGDAATG